MEQAQEVLQAVSTELAEVANGEAVVGSPIKVGSVTLIPVSRLSVGFAAGSGDGEHSRNGGGADSGTGDGGGGGVKVRPVAVIALTPEGVVVLPIPDKAGKLDQLIEKVPALVERFGKRGATHAH